MTRRRLAFAAVAVGLVGAHAGASPQVYRSATDGVAIDVAVFDGNTSVTGLTKDDFEVKDNGVRQAVRDVSVESAPLDVTVALDLSGSISPHQLDQIVAAVQEVGGVLRTPDRCRLLTFGTRVTERARLAPWPISIDLSERQRLGDGTAILDAAALALMPPPAAGHRQLVIVLTDGLENASAINTAGLSDAVRYTDAVVHLILASPPASFANLEYRDAFAALTAGSGGRLVVLNGRGEIGAALRASIDEMHTTYLVRYVLAGVPVRGWHEISVSVTRPGKFTVRARRGYVGG